MEESSSNSYQRPTWTNIIDNPLFGKDLDDHLDRHHHYLKTELERERWLRAKAEALRDSKACDVAIERRMREIAERKLRELSEELLRVRVETGSRTMSVHPSRVKEEQQRRRCDQRPKGKEVENPHIRRGVVGFVEFPRILRSRKDGGVGLPEGKGGVVPNLESQKAQFLVLLKKSRVAPLGNSNLSGCQRT